MAKAKLWCKKNPRTKEFYTSLIAPNGKKVLTLGEGFKRKFIEKHRAMLMKWLMDAEIVYDTPKKK